MTTLEGLISSKGVESVWAFLHEKHKPAYIEIVQVTALNDTDGFVTIYKRSTGMGEMPEFRLAHSKKWRGMWRHVTDLSLTNAVMPPYRK